MCTYVTAQAAAEGSGKGARGWFPLETVTVYFDHPVHAQAEHTMNIDFANPARGAGSRVAVELTAQSALDLVRAVAQVFTDVPEDLTGVDPTRARQLRDAAEALAGPDRVAAAATSASGQR
ncbi:MAG TPA: DUF6295 family protein [Nocardioidaceae bacterium]|nr:DUF6295 family protein [Nocardioidaceae bacterium]